MERQIAGRDLQKLDLTTFASLKNTPALSPFQKVVFYEASTREPSIDDYGFARWTSGMYVRQMVQEFGLVATRGWMRERLGRNLYREWKQVEPFLRVPEKANGIGSTELLRAFQNSAIKQIKGTKEIAA